MAKKNAANKHFVELTQEMLDENPELIEQGYKVGDEMKVEDEETGTDGETNNDADISEEAEAKPKKEAKKAKGPVTREVKNTIKHNGKTYQKGVLVSSDEPDYAALVAADAF